MKNRIKIFPIIITILYLIFNGLFNSSYAGDAAISWTPPTTNVDGTALTDLAGYKVYYSTSTNAYSTILDVGNVTTFTVPNLTENSTYYFAITAYDTYRNESNYSNEATKLIDTTPPKGTVTINNAAINTNSSTITIKLSCTDDPGSGCGQIQLSEDDITWGVWEAYSLHKAYTFSSGEGTKTIYVRYQDNAGNISSSFSDSIIIDKTTPLGSLSINNGVSYTTNLQATLIPSCSDNVSGCYQMRFSNNNSTWSPFRPYSVSTAWQLSNGDGDKTVYIQYKDDAENLSAIYSSAIILDTSSPVISNLISNNITTDEVTISWTTDEQTTSLVEYGTNTIYGTLSNLDNNLTTSHTILLSGLTRNTTYYFRVLSVDPAGNNGVSAWSTFKTLRTLQPETPAPILDIRFNPSRSTKNSIILEWTATGADGIEGTATSYDLRMSRFRIIEDRITPKQGEINFSKAPQITGIIFPAAAGTYEKFQVNQLVPNSVYFFAIKAIDEKGNVSAISNVVNGNNIPALPVTSLRNGYTAISIPLTTQTSDAQTLLSGIVGYPVEVYSWKSNGLKNGASSFVPEKNIFPGYGYLLKSNRNNAVLNVTGTVITYPDVKIPLKNGWNMIGNPYPQDIPIINTYIRKIDTGELKTYEEAVVAGWVSNAIYTYNGSTNSFVMYNTAALKIWQGYWIAILIDGQYELVINKP